jgi:hypothetical protein
VVTTDVDGRPHESDRERANRNLADLLQELRVAGLGVQVLFGFLLALPFTVRFRELDGAQRGVYDASLLLAAVSIGLLVAPVAYHRWVFRLHEKDRVLAAANRLALWGLGTVALSVVLSVALAISFVAPLGLAMAVIGCCALTFATLWFAIPIRSRRRSPVLRRRT